MIQFFDYGWGSVCPQRPIPLSQWDRFDLLCVHEGRLRLILERRWDQVLEAGAGVLIYPHTRFEGAALGKACKVSVQHFGFDAGANIALLPLLLRRLKGRKRGYEVLRMRRVDVVCRDIRRALELAFEPQDETVHAMRVAMLTLILAQLDPLDADSMPSGPPVVWEQLDAWLRTQLHRPITVEQMARQVGLSASHFRQRFRAWLGVPPGRHLHRLRLQEAMRLLRETDLPIKTIAQRLTYTDLPNFYRAFRAAVGITPARYRSRHTLRG